MAMGLLASGGLIAGVQLLIEFYRISLNFLPELKKEQVTNSINEAINKEIKFLLDFSTKEKYRIKIYFLDLDSVIAKEKEYIKTTEERIKRE